MTFSLNMQVGMCQFQGAYFDMASSVRSSNLRMMVYPVYTQVVEYSTFDGFDCLILHFSWDLSDIVGNQCCIIQSEV